MGEDTPNDPNLDEPFAGHFRRGKRLIQDWPGDRTYDGKPFAEGQCFACGFVGKRSVDPTRPTIEEASVDDRHLGHFFFLSDSTPSIPWCLVHAADLPSEAQANYDLMVEISSTATNPIPTEDIFLARERGAPYGSTHRERAVRQALARQRHCPEWFPYREFQSPVEHRTERDMLRIEEDRKAHQTRLAEMEAEVHRGTQKIQADSLEIAKANQATMDGLREIADKTDKFTTAWTRWAVRIAIAALIVVVAQYVFPDFGRHLGELIDRALGYPLGR